MDGYGWMVVDGYGWLWMDGCGWLWMVMDGCGWLWMVVDGYGWMVVDGCGWLWMRPHSTWIELSRVISNNARRDSCAATLAVSVAAKSDPLGG
eukprot:4726866-Prymnesium_polylepis.1